MAKFLLTLYFSCDSLEDSLSDEEFSTIADSYIQKMIEMPEVPRVGEAIFTGNTLEVDSVVHNFRERVVEVSCDASLLDGVITFAFDKEGWDMKHLNDAGKELFFKRLKQFEEEHAAEQP